MFPRLSKNLLKTNSFFIMVGQKYSSECPYFTISKHDARSPCIFPPAPESNISAKDT